jgi:hypothetical protein
VPIESVHGAAGSNVLGGCVQKHPVGHRQGGTRRLAPEGGSHRSNRGANLTIVSSNTDDRMAEAV